MAVKLSFVFKNLIGCKYCSCFRNLDQHDAKLEYSYSCILTELDLCKDNKAFLFVGHIQMLSLTNFFPNIFSAQV